MPLGKKVLQRVPNDKLKTKYQGKPTGKSLILLDSSLSKFEDS